MQLSLVFNSENVFSITLWFGSCMISYTGHYLSLLKNP